MKFPRTLSVLFFPVALAWLGAKESPDATPAPAKPPADFKSLDTDGDGRISLTEFTAPAEKQRAAKRTKAREQPKADTSNASHDDIISPTDSVEGRFTPEVFAQLDINHDKFISPAELEALFGSAHNISQP